MEKQIESFTIEFFKNLKCLIEIKDDIYSIENVPKSFEDAFGKKSPYKISFSRSKEDIEFAGKGSRIFNAINKYLDNMGKVTLLKIDFEIDAIEEIKKKISLKNCEINNIIKKNKNHFFSRFTFKTSFHFLNESEQLVNEIYVHEGKVIRGNLAGYKIAEGEIKEFSNKNLETDYNIAKEELKNNIRGKTTEIGNLLKEKLEEEIKRIKEHYNIYFKELGGDLNHFLDKVKELELKLRVAEENEANSIRTRLEKMKKELVKIGDDEATTKIIKEQDFTIKDSMHKHSLNIDNKLINTTIIYYPIFCFNLYLKGESSGRYIDMSYDPLTKEINKIKCENCEKEITELNLCMSGHLSCNECLKKCDECHGFFCKKCLKRFCSVCGKALCKNCAITCLGCGKYVCANHLRKDCVSGEERCENCLRACLRCHGLANAKFFGQAIDGSKICQKCLGKEKREKMMRGMFEY
ncbi:MAG: hypothetical protein WC548_02200 [Candidatus Pacearchaeota archaeon]